MTTMTVVSQDFDSLRILFQRALTHRVRLSKLKSLFINWLNTAPNTTKVLETFDLQPFIGNKEVVKVEVILHKAFGLATDLDAVLELWRVCRANEYWLAYPDFERSTAIEELLLAKAVMLAKNTADSEDVIKRYLRLNDTFMGFKYIVENKEILLAACKRAD